MPLLQSRLHRHHLHRLRFPDQGFELPGSGRPPEQIALHPGAADPEQERIKLEEQLKLLEQQIAGYEKDITKTQQEKKTLQSQITLLKSKIQKLDLQVKQSNLMIGDNPIHDDIGRPIHGDDNHHPHEEEWHPAA